MGTMAILKNQVLGDPSGKVGGIVNRIVGDKVVQAQACTNFHKSESEASVAIRNRMTPMVAFAKAVISFPELKAFWKKDKRKYGTSAFNEIQRYNAKYLDPFRPTLKNKLVDAGNFDCIIESFMFNSSGIQIEFLLNISKVLLTTEIKHSSALFLTCLFDPIDSNEKYFKIITSRCELYDNPSDQNIKFGIPFDNELAGIVALYKKAIVYFVLVINDQINSVVNNSENIAAEFDLFEPQNAVKYPNPNGWTIIKLQLSDFWVRNMKAEPFMHTQNYYKTDHGIHIFEFNVSNPDDLTWWLMKYGKGVTVLEPPELKLKIIELANNILFNYNNDLIPVNNP
jgi:hypothetical protein